MLKKALPEATELALGIDHPAGRCRRAPPRHSSKHWAKAAKFAAPAGLSIIPLAGDVAPHRFWPRRKVGDAHSMGRCRLGLLHHGYSRHHRLHANFAGVGFYRAIDHYLWARPPIISAAKLARQEDRERCERAGRFDTQCESELVWGEAKDAHGRSHVIRIVTLNGYSLTVFSSLALARHVISNYCPPVAERLSGTDRRELHFEFARHIEARSAASNCVKGEVQRELDSEREAGWWPRAHEVGRRRAIPISASIGSRTARACQLASPERLHFLDRASPRRRRDPCQSATRLADRRRRARASIFASKARRPSRRDRRTWRRRPIRRRARLLYLARRGAWRPPLRDAFPAAGSPRLDLARRSRKPRRRTRDGCGSCSGYRPRRRAAS